MQIGVPESRTHTKFSGLSSLHPLYKHFFGAYDISLLQTAAEGAFFGLVGLRGLFLLERILDKVPLLVLKAAEKNLPL